MKAKVIAVFMAFVLLSATPLGVRAEQTEAPQEVQEQSDTAGDTVNAENTENTEDAGAPEAEEKKTIQLYEYSTELPTISITTEGGMHPGDSSLINPDEHKGYNGEILGYNYIDAQISVSDCEGYELEDVPAKVKVRGNYSSTYSKKPFRIKFDKKQAMCGLNGGAEFKNWVLLNEFTDASMLRNSSVQFLAHSLYSTSGYYATDFRFVKVYINGNYEGLYLLAEQQEVNKNRVALPEPENPEDYDLENLTEEEYEALHNVHTGYFFEFDGWYLYEAPLEQFVIRYDPIERLDGKVYTPSTVLTEENPEKPTGFTIKSDIYFEEQNEFIQHCMQTIWDVLYDAIYADHSDLAANPYHTMDEDGNYVVDESIRSAREAVSKVVDIDSLVDMYIIQEFARNRDANWSSLMFSLDMSEDGDHLLTYTAPWDFDLSFGIQAKVVTNIDIFVMNQNPANPWFALFCHQDWFWDQVYERWTEAKDAGVFDGILQMIAECTEAFSEEFETEYDLWHNEETNDEQTDAETVTEVFAHQKDEAEKISLWIEGRVESLTNLFYEQTGLYESEETEEVKTIQLYEYSTDLPTISITTEGGIRPGDKSLINPDEHKGFSDEIPVYNYIGAHISVSDCEGYELEDASAKVKVRGNYTSIRFKKPYRIKFDEKQAMCGLNDGAKCKNWVLLAEYNDDAMLRNSIAQYVANSLYSTTGNYATDFRMVNLYINGSYEGLYLLAEHQEVNKNRVALPEPEDPEDYDLENLTQEEYDALHNVRTGYFIEYDGWYFHEAPLEQFEIRYDPIVNLEGTEYTPHTVLDEDDPKFNNIKPTGFTIKSSVYFEEQNEFIQHCTQTIWDVIYDAIYADHSNLAERPYHTMDEDGNYVADESITSVKEAVSRVVNIDSLVDMYILHEFARNEDVHWSSLLFSLDMTEDGDHRLTYTAPWDFDQAFGIKQDGVTNDTLFIMSEPSANPWFVVFCHQDWFWDQVYERWTEAKDAGVFSGVLKLIEDYTEDFSEEFATEYQLWHNLENYGTVRDNSFQVEEAEKLRGWIEGRVENLTNLFYEQTSMYASEQTIDIAESEAGEEPGSEDSIDNGENN